MSSVVIENIAITSLSIMLMLDCESLRKILKTDIYKKKKTEHGSDTGFQNIMVLSPYKCTCFKVENMCGVGQVFLLHPIKACTQF